MLGALSGVFACHAVVLLIRHCEVGGLLCLFRRIGDEDESVKGWRGMLFDSNTDTVKPEALIQALV